MARQTPFKLAQRLVPINIFICYQITNWVLISLNSIPCILCGVGEIVYYSNLAHRNAQLANKFIVMARICYLVAEFIPIMSGIYLFTALYFLSKFKPNEYQLNLKAMSLHATSFGLYMVSDLLFIYGYIMYRYLQKMKYETLEICWGITYICSALSQAILCIIFWKLGEKRCPHHDQ